VPRERNARHVDHALLHRRGHDRIELARHRAVDGAIDEIQNIAPVRGIELARHARRAERNVQHLEPIGRVRRACARVVLDERNRQFQRRSARREQ
jgi:hypothetical protein